MADTEVMRRPIAILLAAVALVVAVLGLLDGLSQTTLHYQLPSPGGVTTHSATYGPGVVAAVVAAAVVLVAAVWLGLAAVGRLTVRLYLIMVGLLVVDLVVLVVVSSMSRPTF